MFAAFAILAFTGCDDDDDNQVVEPDQNAQLRVLHASPDAPKVNILVNGNTLLEGVDYAQGSALNDVNPGTYTVQVDAILLNDETAPAIGPADFELSDGTRYEVIAVNTVKDDLLEPLVVTSQIEDIEDGSVRVQVVHATASAPEVDVYVTAPGTDIANESPLGTFAYKGTLGPVVVDEGEYQVRVTPAGSKTVVYDSGDISLSGDLVVAAIPNTGNGGSPIQLVAMDGTASAVIKDQNTPASIRVVHDSPDAPPVDIVVNGDFDAPLVEDLAFPNATDFVEVPADTYNIRVAVANTQTTVIDEDLTFEKDERYSVYAVNFVTDIEPLVLSETTRRIATEAKVRLVHGSPTAPAVDIYVTAPGVSIDSAEPAFTGVNFKDETGFVPLTPGSYQVRVTPEGTKTVAIDTGAIELAGGGIYTAIARDNAGGGTPLGLILLDDAVTP